MQLKVNDWLRLNGSALFESKLKAKMSDFKVHEELSFEPSGEGEHIMLYIEKTGLNTAYLAEQLAAYAKVPLRCVSYAGRKDKFAVTRQWFSVQVGLKTKVDWQGLNCEGVIIVKETRNDRKLRVGAIKQNTFEITLRECSVLSEPDIAKRMALIAEYGVPNYFGPQRFGEIRSMSPHQNKIDEANIDNLAALNTNVDQRGGNLVLAERMLNGETIKNRNKRSMAISALRSWLFNEFVHRRLSLDANIPLMDGDALSLAGSNSYFIYDSIDGKQAEIIQRVENKDLFITSPMWGAGDLPTRSRALDFEKATSEDYKTCCDMLVSLGLRQERRAAMLLPQNLRYTLSTVDNTINLSFGLPSGCFATSVLRELTNV